MGGIFRRRSVNTGKSTPKASTPKKDTDAEELYNLDGRYSLSAKSICRLVDRGNSPSAPHVIDSSFSEQRGYERRSESTGIAILAHQIIAPPGNVRRISLFSYSAHACSSESSFLRAGSFPRRPHRAHTRKRKIFLRAIPQSAHQYMFFYVRFCNSPYF